jgi:predicted HNH restriction endonuclease
LPSYSESDLIIPALTIIAAHPDGIDTSNLSLLLRRQLKPTGADLEILANRTDDKFSQKVRNLKSHDTLERNGLAVFEDGRYYITDEGRTLASAGAEILRSLMDQGFTAEQRSEALDSDYSNIVIEEGERTVTNRAVIQRSRILRHAALKHFTDQNGSIQCVGCGFRAEAVYGPDFRGLIEIHHIRPISLSAGSVRTSATAALQYVVPLCPNCHRVVHADRERCMPIDELKRLVEHH